MEEGWYLEKKGIVRITIFYYQIQAFQYCIQLRRAVMKNNLIVT